MTGASGSLGRALLKQLSLSGAKVLALTSSNVTAVTIDVDGQLKSVETIFWTVGKEDALAAVLQTVDILVLNHGVNLREGTESSALNSLEVNTLSAYRLLERFLAKVKTSFDAARKEVWVVTSEAEILPVNSPFYEMSKQMLGKLVTLKRLDSPCVLRKLVLGDFRSQMSPSGRLSPDWVARQIVWMAKRDIRNIVIAPWKPWVYVLYPTREWLTAQYYKRWNGLMHTRVDKSQEVTAAT